MITRDIHLVSRDAHAVSRDIRALDADALARLLDLEEASEELWTAEDLAGLFRHQLSMPLRRELGRDIADASDDNGEDGISIHIMSEEDGALEPTAPRPDLAGLSAGTPDPRLDQTFGEVLHAERPDLVLLSAIKRFAKREWRASEPDLPREVSISLYFLSIAAALARTGQRISGLDPSRLRRGFRSVLQTPWLDETSRQLLVDALGRVEG